MVKYSLEDIVEHYSYEGVDLNRKQLSALISLYEPNTGELVTMENENKDWVAKHLFDINELQEYDGKKDAYDFARLVSKVAFL